MLENRWRSGGDNCCQVVSDIIGRIISGFFVMNDCIFCKIAKGEVPCHKVWEDDKHLAFLSIFPNTPGFTVLIPKEHYGSYFADVPEDVMKDLIVAARKVAKQIDSGFDDVGRTGMMFEGFGVDHLHAKFFPMHGTGDMEEWKKLSSKGENKFFDMYEGYISSHDSERAADDDLAEIATHIRKD